jgi:hypothetical protein
VPNSIDETFSNLAKGLIASRKMSHSAVVLTASSILEYDLERSLKAAMRPLNKYMEERIFEGYGPLSSFSAKIDMAFAMDIITKHVFDELNKIRKMRNAFAHSKARLSLEEEPMRALFYSLKRPSGASRDYAEQFLACITAIDEFLEAYLGRMGVTEDLRPTKKKSS